MTSRRSLLTVSLLLLLSIGVFPLSADPAATPHVFTVVLDPGHGGKDPGACGPTAQEKNIVLSVAKKVGQRLSDTQGNGIKVIYTRSTDVFVELEQRAVKANKAKADIFISIHTDAVKSRSAYGAGTFTMGLSKEASNLAVAQRENSVILLEENYRQRYEGFDPTSSESYIMFELMQDINMEQSINLASAIQTNLVKRKRLDRGVRQAPYWVLHRTSMPSVLVELGFISNPDEERYLKSEKGQNELAGCIADAVVAYKKAWDSKTGSGLQAAAPPASAQKPSAPAASTPKDGDIRFAVQLFTSGKKLDASDRAFKGLKPVTFYQEKNLYKYVYGSFRTEDEAKKARKSILQKFPDAFVVALKDKRRISLDEARKKR